MMEWKALANAIIHDNFDPLGQITIVACEKCRYPYMHVLMNENYPLKIAEDSRLTITIYYCPVCGHREMDCIGTYGLPDYMPGSVIPVVGHFMMFRACLEEMLLELNIPKVPA